MTSLARRLASANTLWIGLVLLGLIAVFGALRPDAVLTVFTLQTTLVETSVLLVLSVGMTYVIITSGIDLSVGSVLVFSGVTSAMTMNALNGGDATGAGWGTVLVGLAVALLSGAAWGLLNGLLVARAGIPPLIVTLGSFGAALGAGQLLSDGSNVSGVPDVLGEGLGTGTWFGVPNLVLLAAAVTAVGALVLGTTRFGRHTYAIGSNEEAARRAGIGVTGHLVRVYLLAGVLAGLAGFMALAYFRVASVTGHDTDNLNAIAGVVLGGTSLFGGVGSVVGTVLGVFIPAVLRKGFVIVGVNVYWQPIAVALVLVAAVWFDQSRRKARNQR
ncbi:ABC transporter permease [Saccharothrix coeruleofusca]|uniref:Sugar ABC transporter permease n=1 Tax=Saccharothrix coeruleofusca TaxID=33919 RepID=A0A918EC66_9PSEU|nr:ABC transporter permease [Saccharothrix coeruleofusca]MBP2338709.1 ribose transport system permease protein [Saccharothrix coeruleofusca]GGP46520.1 sugar ABC transporter permease [Saccharothrix coeruleofusca]